jgi:hypothetical protein
MSRVLPLLAAVLILGGIYVLSASMPRSSPESAARANDDFAAAGDGGRAPTPPQGARATSFHADLSDDWKQHTRPQWPQGLTCPWKFKSYEPSSFEKWWSENAKQFGLAPCAQSERFKDEIKSWLEYSNNVKSGPADVQQAPSGTAVSKMTFTNCTGDTLMVPMEPLGHVMRHPAVCGPNNTAVMGQLANSDHLIIDWRVPLGQGRKVYMFELKNSFFDNSFAPPLEWLVQLYKRRGAKFDSIFHWSSVSMNAKEYWDHIPLQLQPRVHWFNYAPSVAANELSNPMTLLKSIALPDDFVVLRLDMDPDVEVALVEQILADPALQSLIDEVYWQHKIQLRPLIDCCWSGVKGDLNSSISLFSALRAKGIRAHSWM